MPKYACDAKIETTPNECSGPLHVLIMGDKLDYAYSCDAHHHGNTLSPRVFQGATARIANFK